MLIAQCHGCRIMTPSALSFVYKPLFHDAIHYATQWRLVNMERWGEVFTSSTLTLSIKLNNYDKTCFLHSLKHFSSSFQFVICLFLCE